MHSGWPDLNGEGCFCDCNIARSSPDYRRSRKQPSLNICWSLIKLTRRGFEVEIMEYSLGIEIREKLASYLAGEIPLHCFEDWFVPASWNVVKSKNQADINLVYEIELWLAEFSGGFWNEDELKNLLRPLVENYQVILAPIPDFQNGSNEQVEMWLMSQVSSHILYAGAS